MNPTLDCTSDRDPLSYRAGESMVFSFRVADAPPDARICWRRSGDDGRVERGEAPLATRRSPLGTADCDVAAISTSLDRPGFVRIEADLLDAAGTSPARFDGGAGADVDAIRADTPEPADFDAFWARRKAALASEPMDGAACREIPSGRADVRLFAISVPCAGGRPSTGHLSVPAAPGCYPAQIHFHGYNNSWSEHAYKPLKAETLHADRVFIDLSAHGFELDREPEYYAALRKSCGSNGHDYAFDPIQNSDPDTAYFGGMAWRILRGLEYLKSRPEWNGRDLVVEGGSQGALQSIWAAALDHDVTECRPYIPWCCNLAGPASGRAHGDWFVPWVPALAYYDPVNMAKRIPDTCRMTVEWAGLGDYICPPSGVMAFYNSLACPKAITFVQGATHFHLPAEPSQTASRTTC